MSDLTAESRRLLNLDFTGFVSHATLLAHVEAIEAAVRKEQAATIEALRAAVPVESSRPCGMGCPDIGHCYSCGMESEAGHDPGCEWLAARSRRGVL